MSYPIESINSEGLKLRSKSSYSSNGLDVEMKKTHSDYIIAVLAGSKMEKMTINQNIFLMNLENSKILEKKCP